MPVRKKIILVGIDYSKSSDNAFDYALMMAKRGKAGIMLFHMYEVPVVHTFSGAYFVSYSELQGYNQQKLENYRNKKTASCKGVSVEIMTTYKSIKQGVAELVKLHEIDYVVMGLAAGNKLSKFIYGTSGLELVGKINCPVIIVPESYKKHALRKGILALDNFKTLSASLMKKISEFNHRFSIKKDVVHIKTEDEFLFLTDKAAKFSNKKWKIKNIESENFEKGLLKYAKENKSDLICVVSHSHSLLYNLFNETNTKKLAFKSKVPVMSIHD